MENKPKFKPNPKLKLMDQVRQVLRYHHYSYRTEQTYCDWIIRFVKFQGYQKHPKDMGKSEIEAFLSHLATHRRVAASTQRQALNALVFLYKHVLDKPIGDNIAPVKDKKRRRPPVVMTKTEVRQVLNQMKGTHLLMAKVMYGGGLRLMECLRLRVMDLDFAKSQVYVNRWQYVFPAKKLSKDPRSDTFRRHHVLESGLQKAVKIAVDRAGITKRIGTHSFRHYAEFRIMLSLLGASK